ncbi:carbapenem biosynthesis protein CpmH [Musicola keenii]|uniref:carbapenem biosynthesis protein CpmH n=1 Tax=Musicola keenii TaxID=2884250 RepID=UPI00177ED0F1|nr:carbapenem biosynthesis protein CpmH [Musicola keenii]
MILLMKFSKIRPFSVLYFNVWMLISPPVWGSEQREAKATIQDFIDASYTLCLGEKTWPMTTPMTETSWLSGRLNAMVAAGLVEKKPQEKIFHWSLSHVGEKYFQPYGDFCYGRMVVDKIIHYEKIAPDLVLIQYTYDITGVPAWAKNKYMHYAFSELDHLISGIRTVRYQATIKTVAGGASKIQDYPIPLDIDY